MFLVSRPSSSCPREWCSSFRFLFCIQPLCWHCTNQPASQSALIIWAKYMGLLKPRTHTHTHSMCSSLSLPSYLIFTTTKKCPALLSLGYLSSVLCDFHRFLVSFDWWNKHTHHQNWWCWWLPRHYLLLFDLVFSRNISLTPSCQRPSPKMDALLCGGG